MRISPEDAAASLEAIGFTALEARIYVELLRSGALTGYRIAQLVGKATANTYRALEALSQRGIVYCEDGPTRVYRAAPYAEVAAVLAVDFQRRMLLSTQALSSFDRGRSDDRIYRLHGADQIYERANRLVAQAKSIVVVDAFPDALEQLRPALEDAAANGVAVIVHAYAPAQIRKGRVVEAPHAEAIRAQWPGTWVNVSADGSAALIAHVLDDDRTVGIWTENPHVAWMFYCGIASETALARLRELAAADPSLSITDALRDVGDILVSDVPGRAALSRQISKKKGRSI
jgi:HTH-type transcriptional regulator, sugar sensing transcriptional regulator